MIQKPSIEKSGWQRVMLIILAFCLISTGCISSTDNSETEISQTASATEGIKEQPTNYPANVESDFIVSQEPPQPLLTPNTLVPTSVPALVPSNTLTFPRFPELLIAVVQVRQRGEENETHEIWLMDTHTKENRLVLTTTPGTRLTSMIWGVQSDTLYVVEIKGVGEGKLTWQLYEVNYATGMSKAIFDNSIEGLPRLTDISAKGKWLRLIVQHPPSPAEETWIVNTENGQLTKTDQYFPGFVWSPIDPDVFAHSQNSFDTKDENTLQSVVIRDVINFEIIDAIEYKNTNWGNEPTLVWHPLKPEQITFFILNEVYQVNLMQKSWNLVTQDLQISYGGAYREKFKVSPSGEWLLTQPIWDVEVIQVDNIDGQPFHFEDKLHEKHRFLAWYDDNDWAIIVTESGDIQVYELGDDIILLDEIDLNNYGITLLDLNSILAKAFE